MAGIAAATVTLAHALPGSSALICVVAASLGAAWVGRSLLIGLLFAAILALGVPEAAYAPYLLALPNVLWRGRSAELAHVRPRTLTWPSVLLGMLLLVVALVTTLRASSDSDYLLLQVTAVGWVAFNVVSARRFSALRQCLPQLAAGLLGICLVYAAESSSVAGAGGPNAWAASGYLAGWINRNALAVVFSVVTLYFLDRGLRSGPRAAYLTMCAGAAAATALTFSRSGYLALVIGVIVCVYRGRKKILLLAPLAVLGTQYLSAPILERVEYTSASGGLDASSSLRLELWQVAWDLALEHPFTGVGIQSLADEFRSRQFGDELVFAHNTFLTVLAAYGLVLPLLVAVAVSVRAYGRRREGHADGRWAAVLSVAVSSIFGEPLLTVATLVAILPFLAVTWIIGEHLDEALENPTSQRNGQRGYMVPVASAGTGPQGPQSGSHHDRGGTSHRAAAQGRI
ncbi:hypothetical protein GCM10022399_31000 [Terrabacter ginsenosidimutans]|uniref:O-antigen ligase-related domain-containing protein n=1 Tax=Terrabacter ginsenosidimutans TaxID=490575 RepID=A0ABP7E149_9MICO